MRRYVARYCIVRGHLAGLIIRRCGIYHCRELRPAAVAALQVLRHGGDANARAAAATAVLAGMDDGTDGSPMAWQRPFDSPALKMWIDVIYQLIGDLRNGYLEKPPSPANPDLPSTPTSSSSSGSSSMSPSPSASPDLYQLDSLLLYAAATSQYSHGVEQLYMLLGHPSPHLAPTVVALNEAASTLRRSVEECRGHFASATSVTPI